MPVDTVKAVLESATRRRSKIGDRSALECFLEPPYSSRFPHSHERSRNLQGRQYSLV
jgi:hypothetical protein